jgi:AcrR family transcriptional regulator
VAFDLQMNSNFPALKLRERAADKPQRTEGRAATKTRILAATEKLFIVHGFDATSLRAITTEAGVNLAAVNYHFGSKEELFAIVLTNRLDALNLERVRLLDALEAKGIDAALRVEQLIATMFLPALQLARNPERGGSDFLKFLGRAYADPSPFVSGLLSERYAAQDSRFVQAFAKALPELHAHDLSMRLHFMLDAISSTLASEDARKLMAGLAATSADAVEEDVAVLTHLAPFLAGSLRAKVNQPGQQAAIRAVIASA